MTGYFSFTYLGNTVTIPVGTCSALITVPAGPLTITELGRTGFVVTSIYTIPADRLLSSDLNARTVTVTIVPGSTSSQTIVFFRNRVQ